MNTNFVCYYRVSTTQQGISGLGLDAQQESVRNHIGAVQGTIVAEFTEVESGKVNERPILNQAIEMCRVTGATLLVAKLDRLSRNLHFITTAGQTLAVRAEDDIFPIADGLLKGCNGEELLASLRIPHLDVPRSAVIAATRQAFAVRAEGYAPNPDPVSLQGEEFLSGLCIPDADGVVS